MEKIKIKIKKTQGDTQCAFNISHADVIRAATSVLGVGKQSRTDVSEYGCFHY